MTGQDRRQFLGAATLVAAAAAAPAQGQTPPPATGPYTIKPLPFDPKSIKGLSEKILVSHHDNNYAGAVKRLNAIHAEFAALDTHHTGCLTPDQVEAINQQRIAADQSAATPLQDWNQDGCVDYREFSAADYSLFDELDRNGDGKITPQEFNPRARPGTNGTAPQPQQGGGRRGGPNGGGSPPPPPFR